MIQETKLVAPSPAGSARDELAQLWRLALPLSVGQAGNQLMSVVDAAMVGRLEGAASLAGLGIGASLYFSIAIFGFGIVLGMDAPISQAVGAGEQAAARRILGHGVRLALVASLPLMALCWLAPLLLERCGVQAATAGAARSYLWARSFNVAPFLLFAALRSYLQANHATRPIVVSVVVANVANAVGDALLIFGDRALVRAGLPAIGLPALGVAGCGLSSVIAWSLSLAVLVGAVRLLPVEASAGKVERDPRMLGTILRLGVPMGTQFLAEIGVFTIVGILAGRMSAEAAAGHQVALTLASFTFCVIVGLGSAASVRVGHAVGRGDLAGVRRAGFTTFGLAAGFMAAAAVAFLVVPEALARLLTDDPTVLAAATPLVMIAAVFQLSDGTQGVATGMLRGAGDARAPLIANLIGHYGVGLSLALLLGVKLRLGAPGLWWGLSAGLTAVAIGLVARFLYLTSRPIARV